MTQSYRVTCFDCGQANRVPADKLSAGPKCGTCGNKLISGKVAEVDFATLAKAEKDDLPLLVDFWAPWCGPCRAMAPQFQQAAGILAPHVRLAKINTQVNPTATQRYRIQGIPAFILFHKGREAARAAGARPAADLVAFVKSKISIPA
ncbi:thiol reductase thioredoxin [Thioclava sp. L04-15]|uniref:thioredoxin TrxC n=1 Tax=Thioclava sp. L04-15 TaxID=1915318 RepID=UPI000998CBF8|nr:thioredoxin TrxC [Thioclava sp. L04-15]OOY27518.1 thiol reductase thioredoxin [Thioclava sp. L04-15]TNE93830.1 MAG: thioredoxin TrxC [Paracoccaceae bacterium]